MARDRSPSAAAAWCSVRMATSATRSFTHGRRAGSPCRDHHCPGGRAHRAKMHDRAEPLPAGCGRSYQPQVRVGQVTRLAEDHTGYRRQPRAGQGGGGKLLRGPWDLTLTSGSRSTVSPAAGYNHRLLQVRRRRRLARPLFGRSRPAATRLRIACYRPGPTRSERSWSPPSWAAASSDIEALRLRRGHVSPKRHERPSNVTHSDSWRSKAARVGLYMDT